jgi:hypothetical protein
MKHKKSPSFFSRVYAKLLALIEDLSRIFKKMHIIPESDRMFHQMIVQSSVQTYYPYRAQGLEVTVNTLSNPKQYVGGENNKLYPDIILWRPNGYQSNAGTALVAEQVETINSININQNIEAWRGLAALGDVTFILVIPTASLPVVRQILTMQRITPTRLQTYNYNQAQNNFTFQDVPVNI